MSQQLIFTTDPAKALAEFVAQSHSAGVFVITDDTAKSLCLPLLESALGEAKVIAGRPCDDHKTVEALTDVWSQLSTLGATRHSLIINIGGGMVTDLGGFAAATFKRGVPFINVPTTLLGAVDAAVGGKTGINLGSLKNEVGAFCEAKAVIISPNFLKTLPADEILSGYAEMLKHGLLSSPEATARLLATDPVTCNPEQMLALLEESVEVKRRIVAEDPTEKGLRKALNLGHTFGHAFESMALQAGRPIPHGHAVAHGLVAELVVSKMLAGFSSDTLYAVAAFVRENYPAPTFTCDDYEKIIALMRHDKKNLSPTNITTTLLSAPGQILLDKPLTPDTITAALDITRDLL